MSRKPRSDPHHHTVPAPSDDARSALDLSATENADLCSGCVKCCTYITIEVDAPRAAWEYDQWIWALHHRNVSLFVEKPERWFVQFDTVCERLNEQGRCSIYGRHPVLCREYDPRSCERRLPLSDIRAFFTGAYEFEAWIEKHRPHHWRRLMAHRRDMPDGPPVADSRRARGAAAALVQIGGLMFGSGPAAHVASGASRDAAGARKRSAAPRRR